MLHLWAGDPPAAKAFMDAGRGVRLGDLPEDVRTTYLLRHAAMVRVLETIYRQVEEGVMEPDALDMFPPATPLFRDAWTVLRVSYRADFRAYVEERYALTGLETGGPATTS